MQRKSKKRELVYEVLKSSYDHPTAIAVYERVKVKLPGISLSTVYRNLAEFCSEGKAQIVDNTLSETRYDANLNEHDHFICKVCGRIVDIERTGSINEALDTVKKACDVVPCSVTVYGLCNECSNKAGGES